MEFRNHTPFPALAFEGIDQHDQTFHVVVLRQTLSFATGKLEYADEQAPLCEVDEFFGEMNQSSARQESDLCQYKPKCDVIVNATAYAPQGKPSRRFEVRLVVKQADTPTPLPDAPQGFNPWQGPTHQQLQLWRDQLAQAKNSKIPGATLIDKTLSVTGERSFSKAFWPLPQLATLIKWSSLGLININPWRLTTPRKTIAVPLRYEYAYGGQCRINTGEKSAKRIKKKHKLTPLQLENHPSAELPADQRAIAHTAFDFNPIGRGFTENWYIAATGLSIIPAPQIAYPDNPPTLGKFLNCVRKKLPDSIGARMHAGLGVRAKGHPERRKLTGTIDASFIKSDAWLPQDFDFSVWNAAAVDQQIDLLTGDEIITLHNLCAPDSPMSSRNQWGDTALTLTLPSNECHALIRLESGEMFLHAMHIDTVIIEPDIAQLTLVWRMVLAKDDEILIRVVEARMHSFEERDRLRQEIDEIQRQMPKADQTSSDTLPELAEEMAYV